jgi:hypothetical protein
MIHGCRIDLAGSIHDDHYGLVDIGQRVSPSDVRKVMPYACDGRHSFCAIKAGEHELGMTIRD